LGDTNYLPVAVQYMALVAQHMYSKLYKGLASKVTLSLIEVCTILMAHRPTTPKAAVYNPM